MKKSVVMATYNGAKFIENQLDTILDQTVQPDEVIISDDSSSDETVIIVKKYITDRGLENKWKIHSNPQNKGYAKNFLDAALMAKNELVFFCDQDDLWIRNRLEVMSEVMQENEKINLLCTNLEPFYYEKDTRKWSLKDLASMTNDGSLERHSMNTIDFHLKRSGCTMCIRKAFLENIMPYWVEKWAHDDFVWKMAVLTDSCAILQYNSMKRRMHSNNATVVRLRTRERRIHQLYGFSEQNKAMMTYAARNNIDGKKLDVIKKNQSSVDLRLKVVDNKKVYLWPQLIFMYKDCYPRSKGLLLDLYLTVFGKYRGV